MSVANKQPPRQASDNHALDFSYDTDISKEIRNEAIQTLSRGNAKYREVITEELASRDIVGEYRETFGAIGLRDDNLADTMTAYWLSMLTIIHDEPMADATLAGALRDQVQSKIQKNDLTRTPRNRQRMGEGMIWEAQIAYAAYLQAKTDGNKQQLRQMARSAKNSMREKGMDSARMTLTNGSLRRR